MDLTRGRATPPAPADTRREPAEAAVRSAASGTGRYYARAMEITTILPVRELIIASQRAAAIVSQPRRSRHAIRVVLTRVGHGALHYEARITRRQIRAVTVRFTQDPQIIRVSIDGAMDGAAAAFAAQLHQQIHAADPAAACSWAAAGTQAANGGTAI